MTNSSPSWIVLAHLLRPQGRKGELLCELLTDFPERFTDCKRVFLAPPGFAGEASEARTMEVVSHWLPVGKNEGRIVLHFAGVDSISDAEPLAGLDVIVPQEERLPLDEDSVYINELVGCTVFDGATAIGTVTGVQFAMTADGARRMEDAAPLLAIASVQEDEVLVPFAKEFIVALDMRARRIDMALPQGLLDINRPAAIPHQKR